MKKSNIEGNSIPLSNFYPLGVSLDIVTPTSTENVLRVQWKGAHDIH